MLNLTKLSSAEVVESAKRLISEERRLSLEILWHIREIEARRAFADMGYASMHEMLIQFFAYSEGSAYRRLSAARLLSEVPAVESALREGKLSLTTTSMARRFFEQERKAGKPYSKQEKGAVLQLLEGKSRLEAEKELATLAPQPAKPEQARFINEHELELKITVSEEQMNKLRKLKLLLSHKNPDLSFADLIEQLADSALQKLDPQLQRTSPGEVEGDENARTGRGRSVPAALRRRVWKRASGRCEYVDPATGRRCTSEYQLQVDHIRPYSLGGRTDQSNLRLLCRTHNLQSAVKLLGNAVMKPYLRP